MTLKDKIGQLFVFGFDGTTPTRKILARAKQSLGGIILFKRNLRDPAQIARLTNKVQALSPKMPLFICIDQEGGRISRLPKEFTTFPSAATIGALQRSEMAYKASDVTAKELRAVGINMNFAPVLDVLTNPNNTVIGDRAFSKSPTWVSSLGLSVMAGLQDNKVIPCAKHFPGHGDTAVDSHLDLPVISRSISQLLSVELRPFQHLIENRLGTIMTAHAVYPALDDQLPATLSRRIIQGLLRKQLGFQGVVVTDDLEMKAIKIPIGEAAVLSIMAGADLLLVCHDETKQQEVLDTVYAAVKEGRLTEERIDRSILRLYVLKEYYLLPHEPVNIKEIKSKIGTPAHQQVLKDILDAKPRR